MYKNIAVAYDGSEGSRIALQKSVEFVKALPDTKLSVIYVDEDHRESVGYMDAGNASAPVVSANVDSNYAQFMPPGLGDEGFRPPKDHDDTTAEYSKHMHNSIQQQLDKHNIKASVLALEGNAAKTISAFIEEQNIDLLVIGNSGKSGLQKFFVGSVSKKLIKDSSSSILVVK
ncbi:UspA domain-containing protein [Planococcus antarcticus DSM 14505]|uniref:Universal stress protein n=1 Tax=Planococcus antarcticus DSM 14505 TaxID=1185653 RepID=A0A1C7DK53_9BACL|nr:universal stress protein [Planococcus antarcticus]ANU11651.1 universal stress protein [Planococcus antarcticus DSM 14505]EIM08291.1 UspA domain-containing protein [Planococcus antarcticus DSM 14505]